jgi:hypothetical protein
MITVGFLLMCLVLSKISILVVISVIVMVIGTGLGAWSCYIVFRFPRMGSVRRIMVFSFFMTIGGITFTVVISVTHNWIKVTTTAMACEAGCIVLALVTGIWASNLPPYKETFEQRHLGSSIWGFPPLPRRNFALADANPEIPFYDESGVVLDPKNSSGDLKESKSSDDGSLDETDSANKFWIWGAVNITYPNQLYSRDEGNSLRVSNLPVGEAIDFPAEVEIERAIDSP